MYIIRRSRKLSIQLGDENKSINRVDFSHDYSRSGAKALTHKVAALRSRRIGAATQRNAVQRLALSCVS